MADDVPSHVCRAFMTQASVTRLEQIVSAVLSRLPNGWDLGARVTIHYGDVPHPTDGPAVAIANADGSWQIVLCHMLDRIISDVAGAGIIVHELAHAATARIATGFLPDELAERAAHKQALNWGFVAETHALLFGDPPLRGEAIEPWHKAVAAIKANDREGFDEVAVAAGFAADLRAEIWTFGRARAIAGLL